MTNDVIMPQLGETVAEGKILTWFKSEGEQVDEGDVLFEIETDKVTMEVQSVSAGKLGKILVQAGETAKVGAVVAVLGLDNLPQLPVSSQQASDADRGRGDAILAAFRSPFEEVSSPLEDFGSSKAANGVKATPLARRLIAQNSLDLDTLAKAVAEQGRGKVTRNDVAQALASRDAVGARTNDKPEAVQSPATQPKVPNSAEGRPLVQLNSIRKRTGARLQQNWQTIPHVFQAIEVDFTRVDAVRAAQKANFKKEFGHNLTFLPFIARAVCITLREFPWVNAEFVGDALALNQEVNLGIAVDLGHDGLVVPVVRGADDLTTPGLAKAIGKQIEKARAGKLTTGDLSGGTYSISNNGAFGTNFTAPIINAPQVAILSTDAIKMRPSVVETEQGPLVAARLSGMIGQSFDHRAFDGAYSAAFLSRFKTIIESRDWAADFT
ncbi:2-oxo acid dehydrogenase subunit E2 [Ensifer adhaerens]|uniref:dihydrolipoamide acetyltransferase family protein n=1 Tax=Ensifer adhaerens TaxID=106592 RepID=UPI001CC0B627|nr:dihydrolipoamide acetyltransferase family protein [Ensifer adhaerens]MBZ7924210.1 2-oxo acid dehydrogenase subunit E2 [Ensifer adhaerens]UAX96535.1 2-oxo acid dehydrogenase subunit E2 [Ensifer adhaerens]UAY04121.1 2-oxo acid dehydrogenase subunit E2 [Ensifer adhaerens]UAY12107.1 2-oxo acid dehydrogenase subunit E2 [Ensifer adhaerens]